MTDDAPYEAPAPPIQLGAAGRALWRELCDEHELTAPDDNSLLALAEMAAEARDRANSARLRVKRDGQWLADERTGRLYSHPAVGDERRAKASVKDFIATLSRAVRADQALNLARAREERIRTLANAKAQEAANHGGRVRRR